jgi:hypothetical protein
VLTARVMSGELRRQLAPVATDCAVPLYLLYIWTRVQNALNYGHLRDALNDADVDVMDFLSEEEEDSGFDLRDVPSVHLERLFIMMRESFMTLRQPEFLAVHDERTPHVQGHRIELLQAIRFAILERDSPNAELVRSRINLDFLETVEEPNAATE